jgi:hypothetical protein
MSSAIAQPEPAIKYFISHFPDIFVIAMYKPIKSAASIVVLKNSLNIKKLFLFFLN